MSDIVFTIHDNLPREGPGSAACTRRALANVTGVSARSAILEVGCGPGAQTVDLAAATRARVVALDLHLPYLRELRRRAQAAGAGDLVSPVRATLRQMPFVDGAFDLIWAEGSVYLAGFDRALTDWRRLLRPRGFVAVTELCWLVDDPPEAPRVFWSSAYPAMTTVAIRVSTARAAGYELVDSFTLPESAWWDDYYAPLEARVTMLRAQPHSIEDRRVIDSTQEQIDLYRVYAACYGYVFFVLRRRD